LALAWPWECSDGLGLGLGLACSGLGLGLGLGVCGLVNIPVKYHVESVYLSTRARISTWCLTRLLASKNTMCFQNNSLSSCLGYIFFDRKQILIKFGLIVLKSRYNKMCVTIY